MNNREPWYLTTTAIVLFFIFFWPVGCVLLYLRLTKKNNKIRVKNRAFLIAGIILLFLGLCLIMSFSESHEASDLIIAFIMFIFPGIVCLFFWNKRQVKVKEYNKYLSYINARKRIKLDSLCNKFNIDYDTATNILAEMINLGIIYGYLTDDELIMNNSVDKEYLEDIPSVKKETKIVKCKSCGAKNTVVEGEKKECEYCGSLLQ